MLIGLVVFAVVVGLVFVRGALTQGRTGDPELRRYKTFEGLSQLIGDSAEPHRVIDVRTDGEFAAGHIPSSANIPYDEIARRMADEPRDRLVVVYCRSGRRSSIAKSELRRLGFERVVDFGAVSRWRGELVHP